ncbi:hypothetical protein BASA81_014899 [Batrachochytrium salamandrivorans]|nr:hypothetical protein BASA81_014899 [Batrachochytrium salamandrivorans]
MLESWKQSIQDLTGITLPGTPPMSLPVSAEHLEDDHESNATRLSLQGLRTRRLEKPEREAAVDRIFNPEQKSTVTMHPTDVTKITWGIYRPDSANMGVINLEDFSPEDIDNNPVSLKAVMVVRSLLANELKTPTRSSTSCVETQAAVPMSALWEFSMMDCATLPVTYSLVPSRATVLEPSLEKMVRLVVVVLLSEIGSLAPHCFPSDFQKFPFTQELTNGSTTYANALTPNSTTNSQYDRIAEHLARIGRKNGQSKLHFVSEPFSIVKPLGKFSLSVETAGIDEFTVLRRWKDCGRSTKVATKKHRLSLPVSAAATTLGNSQITIVGKAAGKQVLKTIRSVRSIPTDDKYMKIGTPGFTFSGLSESVGLYQSSVTAPADGWNNLNGPWMIGNGVKYAKNVESSLEAFFTSPVGTKVNVGLDVALDTEPEFDFLYLSVKSSGDVEDFLINSRGVNDTTKNSMEFLEGNDCQGSLSFYHKVQKFSVALKFVSDEGLEFSGATIRSFCLCCLRYSIWFNLV